MAVFEGGGPTPIALGGSGPTEGRAAAVPVYVVSGGQAPIGQRAQRVVVVTSGLVEGRAAVPVYDATILPDMEYDGDPAIPIFIVSGYLNTPYGGRQLSTSTGGLIAYWPLDDTSGTVATDRSGNGRNGAYAGVITKGVAGMGDGNVAISLAGTGNVNIYGASLAAAFNGNEGSFSGWAKVNVAGDWTDGTAHYLGEFLADGSNAVFCRKATTNNTLQFVRIGGGTTKTATITLSDTGWFHFAFTWSTTGGEVRGYINGSQAAVTQTAIGTFAGALAAGNTVLGAASSASASGWKGSLAYHRLDNAALAPFTIARLALCAGYVTFHGDSRTLGTGTPYPNVAMNTASVVAKRYGWQNFGVNGRTMLQVNQNMVANVAPVLIEGTNIALIWGIVNDAAAGFDAAACYTRTVNACNTARGLGCKVIVGTEIDGQSAALNAVNYHTTIWPAYNTLINANWQTFADRRADFGANANLQDATNTTYFNADKTHLTDAGYAILGGIAATEIAAL